MPITLTGLAIAAGNGATNVPANGTFDSSVSFTPEADSLLLAFVSTQSTSLANSNGLASVSGHGTWSKWSEDVYLTASTQRLQLWWCKVGSSPSDSVVTFTNTGQFKLRRQASIIQVTGHDPDADITDILRQVVIVNDVDGLTGSVTLSAFLNGDSATLVAVTTTRYQETTLWDSPLVGIHNEPTGTELMRLATAGVVDEDTSPGWSWGANTRISGGMGLEIVAASAGSTQSGTGAGSLTITGGSASAERTRLGEAAGSLAITGGSATAQLTKRGAGAGSLTLSGSSNAQRTALAEAAGAITLTAGSASAERTRLATASGSLSLSGDASSRVLKSATASGSLAVSGGSATTQRTATGEAAGSLTVAGGSASGVPTRKSTASGSLSLAGTSSGTRTATATASGSLALSGAAEARASRKATATGSVTLAGGDASAGTEGNVNAQGEGSLTVSGGSATGQRTARAEAAGSFAITANADAQRTARAQAAGSLALVGTSSGRRIAVATGSGSISVSADATARVPSANEATAEGTISLSGFASAYNSTITFRPVNAVVGLSKKAERLSKGDVGPITKEPGVESHRVPGAVFYTGDAPRRLS